MHSEDRSEIRQTISSHALAVHPLCVFQSIRTPIAPSAEPRTANSRFASSNLRFELRYETGFRRTFRSQCESAERGRRSAFELCATAWLRFLRFQSLVHGDGRSVPAVRFSLEASPSPGG